MWQVEACGMLLYGRREVLYVGSVPCCTSTMPHAGRFMLKFENGSSGLFCQRGRPRGICCHTGGPWYGAEARQDAGK